MDGTFIPTDKWPRLSRFQEHNVELPAFDRPAGVPEAFEDHAALMFDLQLLAYQGDVTRVVTFMIGREFSGRTYPEIGVPDAHHPISHHQRDPVRMDKCAKINHYHASLFAEYVQKLGSVERAKKALDALEQLRRAAPVVLDRARGTHEDFRLGNVRLGEEHGRMPLERVTKKGGAAARRSANDEMRQQRFTAHR